MNVMECIYELIHHGMYCNLNLKIYYYPTMKISKMIFEIRFGMRFIYFIRSYVKNSLKIRMGNQKPQNEKKDRPKKEKGKEKRMITKKNRKTEDRVTRIPIPS